MPWYWSQEHFSLLCLTNEEAANASEWDFKLSGVTPALALGLCSEPWALGFGLWPCALTRARRPPTLRFLARAGRARARAPRARAATRRNHPAPPTLRFLRRVARARARARASRAPLLGPVGPLLDPCSQPLGPLQLFRFFFFLLFIVLFGFIIIFLCVCFFFSVHLSFFICLCIFLFLFMFLFSCVLSFYFSC